MKIERDIIFSLILPPIPKVVGIGAPRKILTSKELKIPCDKTQ